MVRLKVVKMKDLEQSLRMKILFNREVITGEIEQFISTVRSKAPNEIIPNRTSPFTRNPWRAKKLQPTHPTKLTERTGKLLYMIRKDSNVAYTGKKIRKRESSALMETVRDKTGTDSSSKLMYSYEGRLMVKDSERIKMDSFLSASHLASTGGRRQDMKKETGATLRARFLHEYAGTTSTGKTRPARPIFRQVAESNKDLMISRMKARLS